MSSYNINYDLKNLQETQVFENKVMQSNNSYKFVNIGYIPAYKLFKTTKFNGSQGSQDSQGSQVSTSVDCCICLNNIKKDNVIVIMEQCGHMYHKACLFNWVDLSKKTFCPYCRQDIF